MQTLGHGGRILTVLPTGGWKAARTRTLESVRYVAQPSQAAGSRSFPAPQRAPACVGPWREYQDAVRRREGANGANRGRGSPLSAEQPPSDCCLGFDEAEETIRAGSVVGDGIARVNHDRDVGDCLPGVRHGKRIAE